VAHLSKQHPSNYHPLSLVNTATQAVLFNAVPLLILAALYLTVGIALLVALRREGGRIRDPGFATALTFPCVGVAAAVIGVQILVEQEPIGGHALVAFPAILLALVPAIAVARHWADRGLLASGVQRTREAERRSSLRDRELERIGQFSHRLLDADGTDEIARQLLDEVIELCGLDIANLAVVDHETRRARIVAARDGGRDNERLIGSELALDEEASGISTAVREGAAFAVYDAESSAIVNQRLNAIAKVKSCAFVPMRSGEEVIGVVFAAMREPRVFVDEELALMQTLAAEAGLALAHAQSAAALADALERERLITRISQEVRSRRDLDELLQVAVELTAKAARVDRCYIRLGGAGDATPILVEWAVEGVEALGDPTRLPVSNLCVREARTVAIRDVREAPELNDARLGDIREHTDRNVFAVLATPIVASERVIGVLGFHRSEPVDWQPTEISLAQAVAREVAIAIETARLLRESDRRLAEQESLLKAGEALTSDLRFDVVIERLVEEMRALVNADAAECWTMLPGGTELVCRAVLGLPETELGRRIEPEGMLAEAIAAGKPVLRSAPPDERGGVQFAEMMDAPISSFGEIRGVLGVRSREAGRFDASDLRLIEAFASLASIALRNAEAFEESERQAQIERGFYRIAAILSEPLSAAATLDAVAQAAGEALGGDSAAVLRAADGELELAGAYELADALAGYLRENAAALAPSLRAGKVLASRRLADDSRFGPGLAQAAAAADRRSLLAVPLPDPDGDELGLVLVFFRDEEVFDDGQLELARHVAGAARGALERSELYERERRSRSLAQRLARAGRELAGELDPDNVLDLTVRHAVELLGADGASVRLLEGDEVVVRAATGTGELDAVGASAPSTGWLVGDIVQTRSTRAIAEVRDDGRLLDADPMLAAGYAAYLGVPIVAPDEAVQGILAVYGLRPREWREEEADAMHALAATASAARSNADLYQGVSHEQQRSEAILANVADGIVAVDRDGEVVLWNPAAERVTGVPASEALGRTPAQALGRPLEAGEGALGGSRFVQIRRGGEEVWLSLSEAVMTDPAGAVAGRIYAFRDISAERSVEQMKSDFVSTVSHELRTPLTSIYGFAETLLRQDVLFGDEERATFLRYIASESERLTAIVDRLLSVAQLDSGDMTVQLTETDVGAVVSEAVRSIEAQDGQYGHRFVVALADEPLAAEADHDKLGQVLAHLLDNAIRYSPAGGTVTVSARRSEDAVEVSVEDEGVGIPHAERERIFRKFYRGDAAAGAVGAGATGLGLFLADGLIKAMGGRIRVDSDEGRGSTFVLELRASETET
jgi:two-component system phosphate regulon sensor histidine kinase PhoR